MKFFIIVNESDRFSRQKMKKVIYNEFIRIDEFIYTRFNVFIIIVHIVLLLIHYYFENIDFDFFIIITSLRELIFL